MKKSVLSKFSVKKATKPTSLSVLIPVYNYDCSDLVHSLHEHARNENLNVNIMLGNDCSSESFQTLYKNLEEKQLCTVISSPKNIGAGAMRNMLIDNANNEILLLMDSDTMPLDKDFLQRYVAYYEKNVVVCGGLKYVDNKPAKEYMLRYKYGVNVEAKNAATRNKHPYRNFIGMCFMSSKDVLSKVRFDAEMGMGYEDAYFGFLLKKNNVPIVHIDNPVVHQLKETSVEFLATTKRYIDNLYAHHNKMSETVKLLKTYNKIKHSLIGRSLHVINKYFAQHIERQLVSKNPSLKLFSLYKLLYLDKKFNTENK